MAEFSGKVAIVAGGALGIGRAAARELAAGDASVVICSDREDQVERTVEELRGEDLEVRGTRADVTSSADMKRMVGFAAETYGGVDVLVNSAGVQRYGTVVHTGDEKAQGRGDSQRLQRAGLRLADAGGGLHSQQGRDQRPHPCDGPGSRVREHPGERSLPGLGGHADVAVVGEPV